jgi:hypothetical protein
MRGFVYKYRAIGFALLLVAGIAASTAARADEDVPPMVRDEIEGLLKKKAADLLNQKDSDGVPMKRGTYSRSLKRVDDQTYHVTFHVDTVETGQVKNDQLKTERFLLTVQKNAQGKWAIAKEELKDTYVGLHRTTLGNEFYSFDKLSFEREGLKATASNGYLYKAFFKGEPVGFRLAADDLAYQYAPPSDAGFNYYELIRQRLMRDHPQDLVFKPEYLDVDCDPASCEQLFGGAFTGLKQAGGASSGSAAIRKVYDDQAREFDKSFRENPFGNFRTPFEPDRKYWAFGFRRSGNKEHWVRLVYDSHEPWEVAFYATGFFQKLFAYYAEDVRKSQIPPYELESRDDADSRDYAVKELKGTVELAIEDASTIEYKILTKRQLRELPFGISRVSFGQEEKENKNPKMFINSLQDGEGNDLTWVKQGPYRALVVFPKEIPAGTELTIRLQFTNNDSIYNLNPSYSALDRGGWLPFVRFGDMIGGFDLTVKVPEKFRALGIGKKVSETKQNGLQITRWQSDHPVSFPTIIFGDYIDDGPGFKATKFDGTEIPVRVYVDKVSTQSLDTNISSGEEAQEFFQQLGAGARDIRGKQLKAIAEQAANALNLYREIYGVDYPFGKLDLVADPLGSLRAGPRLDRLPGLRSVPG